MSFQKAKLPSLKEKYAALTQPTTPTQEFVKKVKKATKKK